MIVTLFARPDIKDPDNTHLTITEYVRLYGPRENRDVKPLWDREHKVPEITAIVQEIFDNVLDTNGSESDNDDDYYSLIVMRHPLVPVLLDMLIDHAICTEEELEPFRNGILIRHGDTYE